MIEAGETISMTIDVPNAIQESDDLLHNLFEDLAQTAAIEVHVTDEATVQKTIVFI